MDNAFLTACRAKALEAHNNYRARHGVPSLAAAASLDASAQQWAEQLALTGQLRHSGTPDAGENLYFRGGSQPSADELATEAVGTWYDEIHSYDFSNGGYSPNTGHFTQVVWRSCNELGVGVASGTIGGMNCFFVVCQYNPPGNYMGQFEYNVLPPNY